VTAITISLVIVTLAVPDFVESALLVAVTTTLADKGKSAGAVNTPPVLIVPVAVLPPGTPFTLQLTDVSVAFFTVAVNVIALPSNTEALAGAIDTVTC